MAWDRRDGAPYRARNALTQITDRGIELPAAVTTAVAVLDRIEADTPREAATTAMRDAIVAGADSDEIARLLLADLGTSRLRVEYAQARIIAATRVLSAILAASGELHAALSVLADHAIGKLEKVAQLDGTSLEQLVREGRHDDAQALAEVEVVGAELAALYETRDSYLTRGGLAAARAGQFDCTQYRDPRIAAQHHRGELNVTGRWLHAMREGAELWYPTADEALAAAAPLYAAWEREAQKAAARQRAVGGTSAFV